MKVLLSWLREFVDLRVPPKELAHLLTMSGSEVSSVEEIGANWRDLFIGQVKQIGPHPTSERWLVVVVDLGNRTVTLVTAATNLKIGDRVPVVLAGGSLQAGSVIDAVDFRGVRSEGMLCSGVELGVSPDSEGIYVLEEDAPVGRELKEYLGDYLFDLELTPNRPDCISVLGIAREAAALTGGELRAPVTTIPPSEFRSADLISVEMRDVDLCPRYSAIVLKNVSVRPSPEWMRRRLHLCGIRPISNVVDATNYVMLERGQPLHAFDARKLHGGIVVRRATRGEAMTTLDGEVRILSHNMLVIADQQEAIAVAGVMGGLLSEVNDSTTQVVLESANFDRTSIRRTCKELRLSSEASRRFDKGLDPELTAPSALRAAALMADLSGASVGMGMVDVYPVPAAPGLLTITGEEVEKLLGVSFDTAEMERILGSLGFGTRSLSDNKLEVTVPTFRRDVEGRADLAEELIRIRGYDSIPATLPAGSIPEPLPAPYREWERVARETLSAAGFQEVITYSLVSRDAVERLTVDLGPGSQRIEGGFIPLMNPMTPEQACLRTTLLDSLLRTARANLRHERRVFIFELARVYLPPLVPLPSERRTLSLLLTGPREPSGWDHNPVPGDFFDLKGAVDTLFRALGIVDVQFQPGLHATMHPGRTASVSAGNRQVGYLGEIHPTVAERYDLLPHRLFAGELDFDSLIDLATPDRSYSALPRFPGVKHDIAVILEESAAAFDVERDIWRLGAPLLAELELFDVYRGASIPAGRKSLAYSLTYRAPDRTLTDEDVAGAERRVIEGLSARFGAVLRSK